MQDNIKNFGGTRAFDRRASKIVPLALIAGALGTALNSPAAAVPPTFAQMQAQAHQQHRSVWAIRWEKLHPSSAHSALVQHPAHVPVTLKRWHKLTAKALLHHKIASTRTLSLEPLVKVADAAPTVHLTAAVKPIKPVQAIQVKAARALVDPMSDVTLDFVAADINDVLKALAVQTHANIVSGTDVKGTITVSLGHVSLDEALDIITKLSGYSYAKVGHTYVVGSIASIQTLTTTGTAAVPSTTAVITFNYAQADDLIGVIKQLLPNLKATQGKAAGSQNGGGVLILTGTEADVEQARQIVAQAETALSKNIAASSTVVYNIKYALADDLQTVLARLVPNLIVTPGPTQGFSLKAPVTADAGGSTTSTTTTGNSSGGGTTPPPTGNLATKATTYSLLLTGSESDLARARTILAQVDVRPAQITYEAKVTEINLTNAKNIGLNWDFTGATTRIGEMHDNIANGPPTLGDNGQVGLHRLTSFGAVARTAISDFANVSLDALFKNGDAKLLSNPNIAAVDGQQAAVFIGDTIRYVSSISSANGQQTVTTDSVNVGIKLFVTGKISNDGYVTLNIHPEVSTITGYLSVPGGGQLPQLASREATTTVRVKDGETIAIGGLISEQDTKNISKVPFFGDLPFFGNLFKDSNHTHNRDEVVIFVKVSIQKDAA